LTESELIKACKKGDRQAQELLYRRYSPKLYGVCLRYASDREEAKDFLQEGFMKIYNNLYKYKPTGSFSAWLYRLMINVALENIRRNQKRKNTTSLDNLINDPEIEETIFSNFGAKSIIKMVQKLPEGYRIVFNLYVVEGYSHKEIAEMLDISESTSKSQLSRAKATLRKLIEKVA
jgi:RNA polymerase sigma-70 factor (ECF subfamily)